MYERYTEPARRAIYFANYMPIMSERPDITPVDLMCALLWDHGSRAESLFQLREKFPCYTGCPFKLEKFPPNAPVRQLTDESKQVRAWAAHEANELHDYWIDSEHLLLGILRVRKCDAAIDLMKTGLTLENARKTIKQNRSSRPVYGAVSRWWRIKNLMLYPIPS